MLIGLSHVTASEKICNCRNDNELVLIILRNKTSFDDTLQKESPSGPIFRAAFDSSSSAQYNFRQPESNTSVENAELKPAMETLSSTIDERSPLMIETVIYYSCYQEEIIRRSLLLYFSTLFYT